MRHLSDSFICTCLVILCISTAAFAYSGGTGEPNNPWLVSTAADLYAVGLASGDWAGHFRMTADIDWLVIGGPPAGAIGSTTPFTGTFDGNNHTVFNWCNTSDMSACTGLFATVGPTGIVRNLTLVECHTNKASFVTSLSGTVENCRVQGGVVTACGGLVEGNDGTIRNCHINATVTASQPGGLVGSNNPRGIIRNCSTSGSVTGGYCVGGLVAWSIGTVLDSASSCTVNGKDAVGGLVGMNKGDVVRCRSTGTVTGTRGATGGLIGDNIDSVSDSYSACIVSAPSSCGGLAGSNAYGRIVRSYSAGVVSGTSYVGGFVGYMSSGVGTFHDCFWDSSLNPGVPGVGSGTYPDVVGLATAGMMTVANFTGAGWDFLGETANGTADKWRMCTDGVDYPHLTWEYVQAGDFACPNGVAFDDLARLANDWLVTYTTPLYGADATGDSSVNFADLAIMAINWMQ